MPKQSSLFSSSKPIMDFKDEEEKKSHWICCHFVRAAS
jgi:hypothetical protein